MNNKSLVQEYATVKWEYRMEIAEYLSMMSGGDVIGAPESSIEEILEETFRESWEDL